MIYHDWRTVNARTVKPLGGAMFRTVRRAVITLTVSAGLLLAWALPALAMYHHGIHG